MNKESIFDRVVNVVMPLIIYLFVNLFAQAGFTLTAMFIQIKSASKDGGSYRTSISFVENMEKLISSNTLTVTFITVLCALPIMFFMFYKQQNKILLKVEWKKMYIPLIMGVFASAGISKLVTLLPIDGILGNYSETSANVMSSNIFLQIITLIIIGPIMEELLFRGLIYNRLKSFNEVTIAAYISALIFAVYHFNLVQGIYTFILGILLVYVYEHYKSIVAPMILHIAANGIAVFINYFPISEIIAKHWYLKVPVMLVEIGILVVTVYVVLFRKKNKE